MNIDRESAKWLKLAYETHGSSGLREMAAAMGLDRSALRAVPRNASAESGRSGTAITGPELDLPS
jgi:hypothetical protein